MRIDIRNGYIIKDFVIEMRSGANKVHLTTECHFHPAGNFNFHVSSQINNYF